MKKKHIILLLAIFFTANFTFAVDYYPEMGLDPFYSSLNPSYIDDDEFTNDKDSVVEIIKTKKQLREEKRQQKQAQKIEQKREKEFQKKLDAEFEKRKEQEQVEELFSDLYDEEWEEKDSKKEKDEKFVSEPKKKLTREELEKELRKEEKEKQKALEKTLKEGSAQKTWKDKIPFIKKKQTKQIASNVDSNIELSADYMEYFPERYEVEAVGNAQVSFKAQKTTLTANKIVFNYDKNILRANENVVFTSPDAVTEGDFVRIDLSKPMGWIEAPVTKAENIKLTAKEAFLYSDKIVEYDGVAKILKDETISFGARSFASYVDQGRVFQPKVNKISDANKGIYKLKANTIVIESKDDHEVVTLKNADLYLKNKRIAKIPSVKIVTNKQHASVEANVPAFGSQSMLGSYFGPAVVLNVPGGSTLKLAPIVTYKEDVGFGAIARFRNRYNMTEVAYGTSKDELVLRGRHKIAPGLMLNYSRYANQNEWFMGYRMPKYSAQLNYSKTDFVKDLGIRFSQRYSAGVFVDKRKNVDWGDAEGRFRWMTQSTKNLFKYTNEEGNIGVNLSLVAQTSAAVYTTGDTFGVLRVGPALKTKVGPWNQAVMYYQTAMAGQTPFYFDRYRYGRSNVVLIESLKISKYLSVGYLASLAMNRDVKNDDLFQENRFMVSIGPEYARLTIAYDAFRHNTMVCLGMVVGTKDSDIEFKKAEIKNPDKFGKKKSQQKKKKKKNYKKYLKEAP